MKLNKKIISLLLFLVLGIGSLNAHPFYVSICQLNYNEDTKALEISLKTFTDDLMLGLANNDQTKLFLGETKEHENADSYIFNYLKTVLEFNVNNKKAAFKFVGKEIDKDVVWTYLEIENVNELQCITVDCTLLIDVIEGQSNIVQVNKNGRIKNLLLSKSKTSGTINF